MATLSSSLPRHHLASLFDPHSVLIVSDQLLPVSSPSPTQIANKLFFIPVQSRRAISRTTIVSHPSAGKDAQLSSDQRLDLAVVCIAPARLAEALEALTQWRPRTVLVLRHEQVTTHPERDSSLCRQWGLQHDSLVLGPGSFGLQRPARQLNLCLDAYQAPAGKVAVVTQSSSIMAAILDWAEDIQLGFSALLSVGADSALDIAEVLDFLSMDNRTDSIVLYLERPSSSRRFTSALHAAASVKPVVVLKAGRHPVDHSPAVQEQAATESAVLNALLRRTGALRVRYFIQLFSALKVLVHGQRPRGRRIAIISNGRAAAQLALDVMGPDAAVFPAELTPVTHESLLQHLDAGARTTNPFVVRRALRPDLIEQLITLIANDNGVDGILVLLAPDQYADIDAVADRLAAITGKQRKPVITCLMGDAHMRNLRKRLDAAGTPAFRTPESAVAGFGLLASYHYSQTLAQQTLPPEPLAWPPRLAEARRIIAQAQAAGRSRLYNIECQRLMECFYIPVDLLAPGSTGIPARPSVPPMAIRVERDQHFGPYISFGAERQTEWVTHSSRAVDLPPLNRYLARQLVQRSRLWRRILSRQLDAQELELLFETLERVSDMVCELASLQRIHIAPLTPGRRLLHAGQIEIDISPHPPSTPPEASGYQHLAIHPYPRHWVHEKQFYNGDTWILRPIRPEDASALQDFIRDLSDESRYMRFVSMLRELTPRMLTRYTSIDYDRELALVATITEANPDHRGFSREIIIGFAHYLRNPDSQGAEYALAIADDWHRHGLGAALMRGLIRAADEQGLTYIDGYVLAGNRPMLGLMSHLGFQNDPDPEDAGMRRVWLQLKPQT